MKARQLLFLLGILGFTASSVSAYYDYWWSIPGRVVIGRDYSVGASARLTPNNPSDPGFVLYLYEGATYVSNVSGASGEKITTLGSFNHSSVGSYTYEARCESYWGEIDSNYQTISIDVNHPPTASVGAPSTVAPNEDFSVSVTAHDDEGLDDISVRRQGFGTLEWWSVDGQLNPPTKSTLTTAPATPGARVYVRAEATDQDGGGFASEWAEVRVVAPATFSWAGGLAPSFVYVPNQIRDISSLIVASPSGAGYSITAGTASAQAANEPGQSYSVTVAATGDYSGSNTLTWTITPAPITQFNWSVNNGVVSLSTVPAGASYTPSGTWLETAPGNYWAAATGTGNYAGESGKYYWSISETPPPQTVSASISVNQAQAIAPGSVTVSWASAYATSVTVTGVTSPPMSGSQSFSNLAGGTYTYTITAQGNGGPISRSATFAVSDASISVSPESSPTGPVNATVSWQSVNATTLSISGPGLATNPTVIAAGASPMSGTIAATNLPVSPAPHVFTLIAQTPAGQITRTASVQVGQVTPLNNPPTVSWIQIPDSIAPNQSFTVQARADDADGNLTGIQVFRNGGAFASAGAGDGYTSTTPSQSYSQPATGPITFTATATDAGGESSTITRQVIVTAPGGSGAGEGPLPGTATLVGTLDGEVAVDNHGAANYSIPLKVPPGRSGMEPRLSLNYNSSAGNGPIGLGWSVSTGFPQSITRGRSIAARDGTVRGVNFDAQDKYYLDGKRLLLTGGSAGYGLPGSEYHTEVDSFATITATGTGNNIETFTLVDKNGTTMVFGKNGSTSDGYQPGLAATGQLDALAYAYALKQVRDAIGNTVEFSYTNTGDGEYQLAEIAYTGHSSGSPQAQAKVRFVYDLNVVPGNPAGRTARMDQPTRYIGGRAFPLRKRLDRIVTTINPGPAVSSVYALDYDYSPQAGPTRLQAVQGHFRSPTSGDLEAAPATSITWSGNVWSYTNWPNNLGSAATAESLEAYAFADVNGDGRDDFVDLRGTNSIAVWLGNGGGFNSPVQWASGIWTGPKPVMKLCDLDADGKKDLIYGDPLDAGDKHLYALLSTGSNFVRRDAGSPVFTFGAEFRDPGQTTYNFRNRELRAVTNRISTGDFTGDGRDDVLIHGYDGKLTLIRSEAAGTPFTVMQYMMVGANSLQGTPAWELFSHQFLGYRMTQDFSVSMIPCELNGDGIMDYAWIESTQRWNTWSAMGGSTENVSGGKTLFAVCSLPGGGFSPKRSVADYGWALSSSAIELRGNQYRSNSFVILPGDVNGDGLMDFITLMPVHVVEDNLYNTGYRLMQHTVIFAQGGAGEPQFTSSDAGLQALVTLNGHEAPTWFDKISRGEWTNGAYAALDMFTAEWKRPILLSSGVSSSADNITMQDVNGDGMADYVWYSDTEGATGWWVMYSQGQSFSAPASINLGWVPTPKLTPSDTQLMLSSRSSLDLNGDGIPDYTYSSHAADQAPSVQGFHLSSGQRGDRVTGVTNGLSSTTSVAYLPLTDDAIYTSGDPASFSYPIREARNSSYVVSDLWKDSGGSARAHFGYQYSGNRLDLSGRGSLGFHSFVTLDTQTNLFKYQFLAQSFPMTGLTQREQTFRYWVDGSSAAFRLISSHDNTVVFDRVGNSSTLYPFISQASESRWEDDSTAHFTRPIASSSAEPEGLFPLAKPASPHVTITTQSRFDNQTSVQTTLPGVASYYPSDLNGANHATSGTTNAGTAFSGLQGLITYGNLKKLETNFGGGFTETVDTLYLPPAGALTGRVDNITTTVTSPGYGTQVAPVKRYTYKTGTPLVESETLDANDDRLDLKTEYGRDSLGRITSKTVTGSALLDVDGPSNATYVTYRADQFDDKFDLPELEYNAYDHSTTTVYDPVLGKPTSVTGPNGDQTTTSYDALGRVHTVRDVLKGLETTTTFANSTARSATPPDGTQRGVSLTSAYTVEVTKTALPTITTYFDRLGRAIGTTRTGFNGTASKVDTAYDDLGRVIGVSNPYTGSAPEFWTKTIYDRLGRVWSVTAPNLTETTTTYKGRATIVSVDAPTLGGVNPLPQITSTVADAKGRTVAVWNADNVPTFSDTLGTTGTTPSVSFQLDGFGRMRETVLKDQQQSITATYDAHGRQESLNDPDKGNWSYTNSALGHVLQQTDGRTTVTTSSFDILGRPLARVTTEPAAAGGAVETTGWYYYDSAADPTTHRVTSTEKAWTGALQRQETLIAGAPGYAGTRTNSEAKNAYYYDTKGRPVINLKTLDGKWFYTFTDYDAFSRVRNVRHQWRPAGAELANQAPYLWEDFGYTYNYDGRSYLLSLVDSLGRTWWQADSAHGYDHLDRPVRVRKGNGHWTQRTYRDADGVLTAIATGPTLGSTSIQGLSFDYDGLGNLTSHTGSGGTETFAYDSLNRLMTRDGMTIVSYLPNGNITSKKDVANNSSGTYGYHQTKPHAVTSAWGYTMDYDGNGNLSSRTKAGETWSFAYAGFDKPRWMAKNGLGSEFLYDANRSRTIQLEFDAMSGGAPSHYVRKRVYALGSTLEVNYDWADSTSAWEMKKVRIYVPGPDGVIGAREFEPQKPVGSQETALVYHYDHLGSIESITDFGSTAVTYSVASGNKLGRYSEDPWGQRRDPLDWSGTPPASTDDGGSDSLAPRGYTGHEMLDDLGLVHMNGRIYDPLLGRFLSADSKVPGMADLQAYNRYSYVLNNPLKYTDPNGESPALVIPVVLGGGAALTIAAVYYGTTPQGNAKFAELMTQGGRNASENAKYYAGAFKGTMNALFDRLSGNNIMNPPAGDQGQLENTQNNMSQTQEKPAMTTASPAPQVDTPQEGISTAASDVAQNESIAVDSSTQAPTTTGNQAPAAELPLATNVTGERTYQTYTKTNPETGEVYTGRTSGTGTPAENVAGRDRNHHMTEKGFGPAVLDKSSSDAGAIRGREQILIEANGGAKSQGGTSGNAINGISPTNPRRDEYFRRGGRLT